jgi:hypothetical protein
MQNHATFGQHTGALAMSAKLTALPWQGRCQRGTRRELRTDDLGRQRPELSSHNTVVWADVSWPQLWMCTYARIMHVHAVAIGYTCCWTHWFLLCHIDFDTHGHSIVPRAGCFADRHPVFSLVPSHAMPRHAAPYCAAPMPRGRGRRYLYHRCHRGGRHPSASCDCSGLAGAGDGVNKQTHAWSIVWT